MSRSGFAFENRIGSACCNREGSFALGAHRYVIDMRNVFAVDDRCEITRQNRAAVTGFIANNDEGFAQSILLGLQRVRIEGG